MKKGNTGTRRRTIVKTIQFLDYCKNAVKQIDFSPKKASEEFKISNATFYSAVKYGYFIENKNGTYTANYETLTPQDVVKITRRLYSNKDKELIRNNSVDYKPVKKIGDLKSEIQLGVVLTEESCIDFLKKLGYKVYKPITKFEEI